MDTTGLWQMAVIPWSITAIILYHGHRGQTVVFLIYTTGGAFDLSASHGTSTWKMAVLIIYM